MFGRFGNLFGKPGAPDTLDEAIARVDTAEPASEAPDGFGDEDRHRRVNSLYEVAGLGLPLSPETALLGPGDCVLRHGEQEVFDRLMILYAVSCVQHGEARDEVVRWIGDNDLTGVLSSHEASVLTDREEPVDALMAPLEAQWALMWALSLVPELDLLGPADRSVGLALLPRLPREPVPDALRQRARLRPAEDLAAKLDVYLCLVSSVHFALENGLKPGTEADPDLLEDRLQAFDWLFLDEEWEYAFGMR